VSEYLGELVADDDDGENLYISYMYNYFTTYILKLLHLSLCGAEDGRMMDDIRIPNECRQHKKTQEFSRRV
jgi:hypothetical protein